jgi:hypothetical protein
MRLWSIWDDARHDFFMRHGRLVSDWKHIEHEHPEHLYQYQWMARHIPRRPDDVTDTPPVWAWYAYRGRAAPAPSLSDEWLLPAGSVGYCVELAVEEKYVLLSQFLLWIEVLNGSYVTADEHEDERLAALEATLSAVEAQGNKEATWSRIFDLDFGSADLWGKPGERQIQACLASIREADVVEIRKFIAT